MQFVGLATGRFARYRGWLVIVVVVVLGFRGSKSGKGDIDESLLSCHRVNVVGLPVNVHRQFFVVSPLGPQRRNPEWDGYRIQMLVVLGTGGSGQMGLSVFRRDSGPCSFSASCRYLSSHLDTQCRCRFFSHFLFPFFLFFLLGPHAHASTHTHIPSLSSRRQTQVLVTLPKERHQQRVTSPAQQR